MKSNFPLQMDEMAIEPNLQYDPGSKQVLGTVTLPPKPHKLACKLFTTILTSITREYKQVVAYDFTGPSVTGRDLWAYVKIKKNTCQTCQEYALVPQALDHGSYTTLHPRSVAALTTIKSKGNLVHPSEEIHNLHLHVHGLIENNKATLLSAENPVGILMDNLDASTNWGPACHQISRPIIKRLATLKLHALLQHATRECKGEGREIQYSSKSAMRATAIN